MKQGITSAYGWDALQEAIVAQSREDLRARSRAKREEARDFLAELLTDTGHGHRVEDLPA